MRVPFNPHPHQHLFVSCLYNNCHANKCGVISHCSFLKTKTNQQKPKQTNKTTEQTEINFTDKRRNQRLAEETGVRGWKEQVKGMKRNECSYERWVVGMSRTPQGTPSVTLQWLCGDRRYRQRGDHLWCVVVVQSLSCVRLFVTPWTAAHQASLSFTNSWSSLKLMSIESVMPSSHLILCCPLLLLLPIPPSIRVFSNESVLHIRWPKYWSFSFSISPSNEYQDWSPLGWTGWISLLSKGLSRVFNTTAQKHQFLGIQSSLWSNSHIHTWLLEKP